MYKQESLPASRPAQTGMCPRCDEVLSRFTVFDVDLNQCPRCEGLWFEARELEAVKDAMDADLRFKDLDLRHQANPEKLALTRLACPACGAALRDFRFGPTRIELDYCPPCNGLWLDKGKLELVLESMREALLMEPLAQIEKEMVHELAEIFNGHKGPWGNLKDFVAAWHVFSQRFLAAHPNLTAGMVSIRRSLPF